MTKMTLIIAVSISSLLTGCAMTQTSKPAASPLVKTPRVLEQERIMREREDARQDEKDRNRVLSKKNQIQSSSISMKSNPQNKKIELVGPVSANMAKNEKDLYAELVGSYDRNNEIAFFSRLQAFLQNYPKSPLADDALYLAGLMSLSNKNYGPALRYLNQVLKKYPTSNKASASLFAKGVALKKMNLTQESRIAFMKVRKSYPGSPEALRAETELKLLVR
jgi:TolA-binding protein